MEIDNILVGTKLSQIQKKPDVIRLEFENSKTHVSYIVTFTGLLFETSGSTLNRRVRNIQLNNTLGMRATNQLHYLNRDPKNYRQLYIQMEGSSDDNKLELLGALRTIKISPKRKVATKKAVKKVAKKGAAK